MKTLQAPQRGVLLVCQQGPWWLSLIWHLCRSPLLQMGDQCWFLYADTWASDVPWLDPMVPFHVEEEHGCPFQTAKMMPCHRLWRLLHSSCSHACDREDALYTGDSTGNSERHRHLKPTFSPQINPYVEINSFSSLFSMNSHPCVHFWWWRVQKSPFHSTSGCSLWMCRMS